VKLRTNWLIAAACILATSSIQAESPVDGLNDNPSVRLLFALDPFEEPIGYLILEGNAKEMILRRFGEPIEDHVSIVPTRFPDETYTSYSYRFEDISFTVGKWPDRDHSWIESIEIDGNSHRLKSGIGIGSSREQVASVFSPSERSSKANPMGVSVHIFEERSDVGEGGSTLDGPGATYDILFEFDEGDRVRKILVNMTESS
jgi:hypothetical protein